MFRVEMRPAACGDCLWIEYGTPPATHIVVIDGGVGATAKDLANRIAQARAERGVDVLDIELLVVTHIDNDHIGGVLDQGHRPHPLSWLVDLATGYWMSRLLPPAELDGEFGAGIRGRNERRRALRNFLLQWNGGA